MNARRHRGVVACRDARPGNPDRRTPPRVRDSRRPKGDREPAIEWYGRALEVDPDFENARRMLDELGVVP
jgi:hypothetical protein